MRPQPSPSDLTQAARFIREDWRDLPEAAALLAELVERLPCQRIVEYRFKETALRYTGPLVRKLRKIYRLAEPPIDTPAWRDWLACDEQQAIAEVVGQKKRALG